MNAVVRIATLAIGLLCGCTPRGEIILDPDASRIGKVETLYVVSSRKPDPQGIGYLREPGTTLSFARFEVSVPPERELGTVRFSSLPVPDANIDFLTVSGERIADGAGFVRAINAAVQQQPLNQREAFVFVHGFNTNFAEGLYRQAQMRHDFGESGISVHYAWPSAAQARSYAADREAVLQARDDLDEMIDLLSRTNVSRIVLVGHSMGAMLVMEALRQRAIRDAPGGFRKIETVVLIAPDIDVGVFNRQAGALADQDVSIYVFSSTLDRALGLSATLRGTGARLGSLADDDALQGPSVTIIDLSDVTGNEDSLNHFKVATSPVMIGLMQGMTRYGSRMFADAARGQDFLDAGLGIARDVTSIVITPPLQR